MFISIFVDSFSTETLCTLRVLDLRWTVHALKFLVLTPVITYHQCSRWDKWDKHLATFAPPHSCPNHTLLSLSWKCRLIWLRVIEQCSAPSAGVNNLSWVCFQYWLRARNALLTHWRTLGHICFNAKLPNEENALIIVKSELLWFAWSQWTANQCWVSSSWNQHIVITCKYMLSSLQENKKKKEKKYTNTKQGIGLKC